MRERPVSLEETLEDLGRGFELYQPYDGFRFGEDSVLLASFAWYFLRDKVGRQVLEVGDFCAGSGVVGFLLAGQLGPKKLRLYSVEWQEEMACRLARNAKLNEFVAMQVYQADITAERESWKRLPIKTATDIREDGLLPNRLDAIVMNPPYDEAGRGLLSEYHPEARAELVGNLKDYMKSCIRYLKPGGELFWCQRSGRLSAACVALEAAGFSLIGLLPVAKPGESPKLLLFRARKKTRALKSRPLCDWYTCDLLEKIRQAAKEENK